MSNEPPIDPRQTSLPGDQDTGASDQDPQPNFTDIPPASDSAPTGLWTRVSFVLFMLILTVLFVVLGVWQLNRLETKLISIALIDERISDEPIALPPFAEWVGFDAQIFNYRPVEITGRFDHQNTVRVFTALSSAYGAHSGPGYWIVAPFQLVGGGAVFVNRGFVPQQYADEFTTGGAGALDEQTLAGVARTTENANAFTPGPDMAARIEWVRNVDRMYDLLQNTSPPDRDMPIPRAEFLPIYIDVFAQEAGALPQGGETRLTVTNRHLEYAWTWFAFAILTPLLLIYWLWRETKR